MNKPMNKTKKLLKDVLEYTVEAVQVTPTYNNTTDKFLKVDIINSIRNVFSNYGISDVPKTTYQKKGHEGHHMGA